MKTLDEIDRRILTALQRDATPALDRLGEVIGLSRNALWRRIKALEDAGVIRACVALVDPSSVGLNLTVFIMVRTSAHDARWLDRFAKATRAMPEILGAYRMTGELDYLIRARVRDVPDYDRLYQRLIQKVDMSDVSASFVMEELKETTALPL